MAEFATPSGTWAASVGFVHITIGIDTAENETGYPCGYPVLLFRPCAALTDVLDPSLAPFVL